MGTPFEVGLHREDANGTMPREPLMESIELIATKVAPRVRKQLGAAP